MTTEQYTVIRGLVDAETAVNTVNELAAHKAVSTETAYFYPYYHYTGHCTLPALFGRKRTGVSCLVDAVTGHGATTDSFATDRIDSQDERSIPIALTQKQAGTAARRTLTHTLGRNLRVISAFDLDLNSAGMVYKKFWIVADGQTRVLVDSVTGGMHPLRTRISCNFQ